MMTDSAPDADVVLQVSDLNVSFSTEAGPVRAVCGLSVGLREREVLGVVGDSGAGKTAMGLAILGLLPSTATATGSARWRGVELLGASPQVLRSIRGQRISMIFQDPAAALNPVHSIGHQLGEAVRAHQRVGRREARERAADALAMVGLGQRNRVRSYPHELSGGMRQRAMIAMAVINRPEVIIADEPTTALDANLQARMLELLLGVGSEVGSAIMLITHNRPLLAGVADRVLTLDHGHQVAPSVDDRVPSGRSAPRARRWQALAQSQSQSQAHAQAQSEAQAQSQAQSPPLLEVRDLVVEYAGHRVVDAVSFDLTRGHTLALVGESGCGKTTTARAVLQLVRPTAGSVRLAGRELVGLGDRGLRPLRRDLQVVSQNPFASLNPRMSVHAIIAEGLRLHALWPDERRGSAMVSDLLDRVGLSDDHATRRPHELSGGQRQRVAIARALALTPRVLLLDEPVSALDASARAAVVRLLDDLQTELGLTYLLIAHDLAMVREVSDRVAVMRQGQIVEIGPPHEIFANPRHPYTQALVSATVTN